MVGTTNNPKKIFEQFRERYARLLFVIDSVGPFDFLGSLFLVLLIRRK